MGDITQNFSASEFACKCGCGYDDIDLNLVMMLQQIRDKVGFSLPVNSGCRCEKHNAKVGSKPTSAHITGNGVDVGCTDSVKRFRLLKAAFDVGFKRIGVHKDFIHLDNHATNPQPVVWFY